VTELLAAARDGDRAALDQVVSMLYGELRRLASAQARRFRGDTLSTTALVHEAYLRLVGDAAVAARDRAHLLALAARAMRHILIDHLRRETRKKRGGELAKVSFEGLAELPDESGPAVGAEDLLALDQALERLAAVDPDLVRLVEWRFFAGLTLEEIAGLTGTSERTLKREWAVARAFLMREIAGGAEPAP
jgi:RNA polymerase sigma factor (TIGR02999 family)